MLVYSSVLLEIMSKQSLQLSIIHEVEGYGAKSNAEEASKVAQTKYRL